MNLIMTRAGVEIGTDAARRHVTRCRTHDHTEVWPSGAVAAIASQPPNLDGDRVPSAYHVVALAGRFCPLRFGKFQVDVRGVRLSFAVREDASLSASCPRRIGFLPHNHPPLRLLWHRHPPHEWCGYL